MYYMCETCVLQVFYTCITGLLCNTHVAHLVVYRQLLNLLRVD